MAKLLGLPFQDLRVTGSSSARGDNFCQNLNCAYCPETFIMTLSFYLYVAEILLNRHKTARINVSLIKQFTAFRKISSPITMSHRVTIFGMGIHQRNIGDLGFLVCLSAFPCVSVSW